MFKNKINAAFAVMAGLVLSVGQAQAAVPTEVTTAFTDVGTDIATYSGLVIIAIIAITVAMLTFRLLRKMLSKAV